MVEFPERIWAFESDGGTRGWLHTKPPAAIIDLVDEYVRVAALSAKLASTIEVAEKSQALALRSVSRAEAAEARLAEIETALARHDNALARREHGGVAAQRLIDDVRAVMEGGA
jgi:hypothetical protein